MIATTDRFVIYLDSRKKRQLSAVLAGKGEKIQDFFGKIIDQIIDDEKNEVISLLRGKKEKPAS